MTRLPAKRGRVAVIGAGPGGMAAALSLHQAGHDVVLFERYKEARPAGNILNLWPPPIKALGLLGVDIDGPRCARASPSSATPAAASGSASDLPEQVVDATTAAASSACCAPSCTSGCSPRCRPGVLQVNRDGGPRSTRTRPVFDCTFADGRVDEVRRAGRRRRHRLPGPPHAVGRRPKREHNLHIFGGFTFDDSSDRARAVHPLPQPHRPGQLDRHPRQGP